MIRSVAKLLISRWAIGIFNLVIFAITLSTLRQAAGYFGNSTNEFDVIEDLLDGIATIFVAYGVALEERDTLMKFFGLYPGGFNDREDKTDHLCHFYGLWFLLLGLFMEVTVEIVKMPKTFLNTSGNEGLILATGFSFCTAVALLLLYHAFLLTKPSAKETASGTISR